MSRFIDVCGIEIDLDMVIAVGRVEGDPQWGSYNVSLHGLEDTLTFYENRSADEDYFPREKLLKLLKGEPDKNPECPECNYRAYALYCQGCELQELGTPLQFNEWREQIEKDES